MDGTVRLTDDEMALMFRLIRRYAETDMDQWENWRMNSQVGTLYVSLTREPAPGASPDAYLKVPDEAPH